MQKKERALDIFDAAVKRPGMYLREINVEGFFDLLGHYNIAIAMSEEMDRADRDIAPNLIEFSEGIKGLVEFINSELSVDEVGFYELPDIILNSVQQNEEKGVETFVALYKKYRGGDYCHYLIKFRALNEARNNAE